MGSMWPLISAKLAVENDLDIESASLLASSENNALRLLTYLVFPLGALSFSRVSAEKVASKLATNEQSEDV